MTNPRAQTGRWSDEHVELFIGNLLRAGVIIAALIAAIGGVMVLATSANAIADYHVFRGQPDALRSVTGVLRAALHLDGAAIVQLGILLLIATPIARVALSLLAFAKQHDRMYIGVTAIVLGLLLFGLVGPGV